jgi:hypothetical protein
MNEQDRQDEKLESTVAEQSGSVFAAARERALATGESVVASVRGVIYEVFPDGRRREMKRVAPPTRVVPGTKWILR